VQTFRTTGTSRASAVPVPSHVWFVVAILGFSFWFFLGVPFASHRETYSWLAAATTSTFEEQISFGVSSTYRPISQGVIWLLFKFLDTDTLPTGAVGQALLQGLVYVFFVLAWWLIYLAVPQRRVFALLALAAGAVLFSGYVHLFHIYGLMYVPVILVVAFSLHLWASGASETRVIWCGLFALAVSLWHPIATAVFVGFYVGFCVETFPWRERPLEWRPLVLIGACAAAVLALVVLFPRERPPTDSRLLAFMASYRTNEVNVVASLVVLVLGIWTWLSMELSRRSQAVGVVGLSAIAAWLISLDVPVLFLWLAVVLIKLVRQRLWCLCVLLLTAVIVPLGGATGTPMHALFSIVVMTYATALGSGTVERKLAFVGPRYVLAAVGAAAVLLLLLRTGVEVPVVTRAANPLLAERERTYQLEAALAWLQRSRYCSFDVAFSEPSGAPVDSVEAAIERRNRPPAAIEDVRYFWDGVLRCPRGEDAAGRSQTAVISFGESMAGKSTVVYEVPGRYAGTASVWIASSARPESVR
jgi:hypothetical protein